MKMMLLPFLQWLVDVVQIMEPVQNLDNAVVNTTIVVQVMLIVAPDVNQNMVFAINFDTHMGMKQKYTYI